MEPFEAGSQNPPIPPAPPPPPDYQPVPMSNETIAQLREASGWSRFVAIAGFVACGLLSLVLVGLLVASRMGAARLGFGGEFVLVFLPVALLLFAGVSASVLVWGYGRGVSQFFTHGEPSLTRGFSSLRHFFTLWTILVALTSALKLISVLRKLM
jgi:hypothetical protein